MIENSVDRSILKQNDDCAYKTSQGIFNYRVGAIIARDRKILMATNTRDKYYYSVGGRVRFGETSEMALKREIIEELGIDCIIGNRIAVHENFFEECGIKYHEIALFYYVELSDYDNFPSEQLTDIGLVERFEWLPIDELGKFAIYPPFFKNELSHFITNEW